MVAGRRGFGEGGNKDEVEPLSLMFPSMFPSMSDTEVASWGGLFDNLKEQERQDHIKRVLASREMEREDLLGMDDDGMGSQDNDYLEGLYQPGLATDGGDGGSNSGGRGSGSGGGGGGSSSGNGEVVGGGIRMFQSSKEEGMRCVEDEEEGAAETMTHLHEALDRDRG